MNGPRALVLGADLEGLAAAATLARAGLRVSGVDAASEVGGAARRVEPPAPILKPPLRFFLALELTPELNAPPPPAPARKENEVCPVGA